MHLLLAKGNQISISTKTLQGSCSSEELKQAFGSVEKIIVIKQAQGVGSTLPGSPFADVDPGFHSLMEDGSQSSHLFRGASVFFGSLIFF